jgi:hypothetical protein
MVSQKRRRLDIKRKRKRREARTKIRTLTPRERQVVEERREDIRQSNRKSGDELGRNVRTLFEANAAHFRSSRCQRGNLLEDLEVVARKFPGRTLQYLDESTGLASYPHELVRQAKIKGIAIELTKTDIDPRIDAVTSATEELYEKMGSRKFHFITSTIGGPTYGPFREKSVANIIELLAPGGVASISTSNSDPLAYTGVQLKKDMVKRVLKNRRDISVTEIADKHGLSSRLIIHKR